MNRRRYAGIVAGLAAATLAGGTTNAAAEDERRVISFNLGSSAASDVAPAEVAAKFVAMVPTRVLDTRVGTGTGGVVAPVGPRQTITVDLSAMVPADATAVVLNVTGTNPTASTHVTVFPAGMQRPLASNLNLVPNQTRPNAAVIAVPPDRRISLYNNAGNTHLIADLSGFYTTSSTHGFTPMSPVRILDTRLGSGPLGPGGVRTVDLSGLLPPSASAVTFNLTGTEATGSTFVTAWPTGSPRPVASNLNLTPGETAPNQVTVQLGTNRQVNLYNNVGNTHLIVDVAGYYAASTGSSYFAISPVRLIDTRLEPPPLTPDDPLIMRNTNPLPTESAITFNLTGTQPSTGMHLTTWPGNSPRPLASNLNLSAEQTAPNLVTVAVSRTPEGYTDFWTANSAGSVHVIMDMAGYFA
jgi:hypothetical protein